MDISKLRSGAKFKGIFEVEVLDQEGNLISKSRAENIITDEGLNHILNVVLHAATQITTWYCVMFESDTTPDGAETYAVPVFTEWEAYTNDPDERPVFDVAESTEESSTNSASKAAFTANDTKTLYGAGLVGGGTDGDTKGDAAGGGTLLCCGTFDAEQPVVDNNIVNLTYTITAADAG